MYGQQHIKIAIFIFIFSCTNLIKMGKGTDEVEKVGRHFKMYQGIGTGTFLFMKQALYITMVEQM